MPRYYRRSSRRYYRPNYNGRFRGPRRQINKYIKNVTGSFTPDGATVSQEITTFGGTSATEAIATGTLQGLRWDVDIQSVGETHPVRGYWAIVIVREGYNPNSLNIANGANLYTPEQDVLAYGVATVINSGVSSGPSIEHFSDQSRTMRKVQQGDRLILLFAAADDTGSPFENGVKINGTFQFFVKG